MVRKTAITIWSITKQTLKELINDDPLSKSAVIAFYTIFSLPAILIIMVSIAGSAFGRDAVKGELALQIEGLVGSESAEQIQEILTNISMYDSGTFSTIIGVITLLFSATTVFISIQDSLNSIFKVRAKPEKGWLKLIIDRVLSFSMVTTFGFLMLVSLALETILNLFTGVIRSIFSNIAIYLLRGANIALSLSIITLIFALLFKILPDAKIKWKDVWTGGFVTAILFTLGKYLIGVYLGTSDLSNTYGAAGSFVLILLWVYYSSLIMLIGAKFTQIYSKHHGRKIKPADNAVRVEMREIESDS